MRETGSELATGHRALLYLCWLVATALGGWHAWVSWHVMSMDGVCYIDMGEAYLEGKWDTAINGLWSPLYSWLIGVLFALAKPGPTWEFPLVHVVNFLTYLASLTAFHFLLCQFLEDRQDAGQSGAKTIGVPRWTWIGLGYGFFTWAALTMVTVRDATPDLCVAACVFVICALLMKVRRGAATRQTFAVFGVMLGLGFLSKAVMFPLAFVFLVALFLSQSASQKRISNTLLAALLFVVVAAPLIVALSAARGRATYRDAGKLNYAWHVNGVDSIYWTGSPAGSGQPVHGYRKIFDHPPVFEFATPVGGTHPGWYDPSYWYEGLTIEFDWNKQVAALLRGGALYYEVFVRWLGPILVLLLALYLIGGGPRIAFGRILAQWALLAPCVAALLLYAAVHVESRYIGPFVVVMLLSLLAAVRLPQSSESRKRLNIACVVMLAFMTAKVALAVGRIAVKAGAYSEQPAYEIAEGIEGMGLEAGDRVAHFGFASPVWARPARLRLSAEMFFREVEDREHFLSLDEQSKRELYAALRRIGARLIVAELGAPEPSPGEGWERIGQTNFYTYLLE